MEEPVSDDINDLSDNSILEFAENINGAEGYSKDKVDEDSTEKKTKENKSKKNSTKEHKDE